MSLVKNQTVRLRIQGYTAEGWGVGRTTEGIAVFVPFAARGDELEVLLVRVKKQYAFGKILRIVQPSPARITPDCPAFGKCGGCDFRHLTYQEELSLKAQRVQDAMNRIGGFALSLPEIVPSPEIERYRNKAQFPASAEGEAVVFGFYRSRSHQLIPLKDCKLQSAEACNVAEAVCRWAEENGVAPYDEQTGSGLLRHIYLRRGEGGLHLTLVVAADSVPHPELLRARLARECPAVCGAVLNCNTAPGNRILGERCRTLWGEDRLRDRLAGHEFRLSPLSFYQVNHAQCEQLYDYAVSLAAPHPETLALDLYCGVGTITLALAEHCRAVTGVELVAAAIADAKENAARNGVSNVRFLCADAGQAAQALAEEGFAPEVIVVDPPRKGLDQAAIDAICRMQPQRIVYVSCDCASLARDARALASQAGYQPQKVLAFDMFPRTANVETVVLLSKGEIDSKKVRVEFSLEDMDMSDFQDKATYTQIKDYVLEHSGLKVSNLYISQIKRKCGLEVGKNYNLPKAEDSRQPQCPSEKENAIREAMKYFGMI